ncbi:MAG: AEC family transporter [Anaerolineales bacterium]|nr:AEC family transporter [Anaerolineales bacterium]
MTSAIRLLASNIAPIILVSAVGGLLQRQYKLDPVPISKAIFFGFGPALVFQSIVNTTISAGEIMQMGLFGLLVPVIIGAIAFALARLLKLSAPFTAAFVLSTMFLNAGNYGLPLVGFAFGEDGLAWATIFFIMHALMLNSIAVIITSAGKEPMGKAITQMFKVPAVYAIPIAFLVRSTSLTLPLFVDRSVDLLAEAAIPSMLFLLGMQIARSGWPKRWGLISLIVLLRLVLSPLIAFPIGRLVGLTGIGLSAGVAESAMPSAVIATVLSTEFDVVPDLVTGAVLITTLISPITLTIVLSVLGA